MLRRTRPDGQLSSQLALASKLGVHPSGITNLKLVKLNSMALLHRPSVASVVSMVYVGILSIVRYQLTQHYVE